VLGAAAGLDADRLFAPLADYSRIGVAVSGGPDSFALMLLLHGWAEGRARLADLVVYTVDHGLRPGSAAESAVVKDEAQRLGLRCQVLRWEGQKPQSGLQAAARAARYGLMATAMAEDQVDILVTAHHLFDQAETVLMRLGHGSGIGGLGGMSVQAEIAGIQVFRPLLGVAPETLAAVVAESGRVPIEDPSNADAAFERVRIRAALPMLAELGLTPARLGQFAMRAHRADKALSQDVDALAARELSVDGFGHVTLSQKAFAALDAERQVRLVQRALVAAGGGAKPFALATVEDLATRLLGAQFRKTTLHGAIIARHGKQISFAREVARMDTEATPLAPDRLLVWDNRFMFRNQSGATLYLSAARSTNRKALLAQTGLDYAGPMYAVHAAPLIAAGDGAFVGIGTHVNAHLVDAQFCGLTGS
jgi:tRNA(Ile)-lysidine synthase